MIPFLDLRKQHEPLKKELLQTITQVIDSSQFILGKEVKAFEEEIATYLGVKHAIGVASGSDALLLALMALGIKEGDEIITSPFTFFATAGSITRIGAKPIFVDIDEKTYNLNPKLIEAAITKKTKAIMPVHIFGQACEMDEIMSIAKKHGLKVIEDACQAIGAEWDGKKVGSIGDMGTFSFFPTKNLGGMGDGGLITTNNDEYAAYLRKARVHGAEKKYHHQFIGLNSRLDALQAAILRIKLKYLDEWNAARKEVAEEYNEALKEEFITPYTDPKAKHTYHQYALLAKNKEERDATLALLKEKGVAAGIYYPVPLHKQECFKEYEQELIVSEKVARRVFSLPIYPKADFETIISALKK